jgi:GTPase SAR1 family protein
LEETTTNCPEDAKIMIVGNKIDLTKENKVYRPVD